MWLNFDVNPYALSSLLTSLLVIGLIGYIVRQRYQTITLRWLVATMVTIWVWSTAEFFIRISAAPETARLFKYWEIAGYILIGPTAVGLCLAFVGKERILQQWKWLTALFLPAAIFIFAAWTQDLFVSLHDLSLWHRTWYGEWAAPLSWLFTFGYVPWLNILLIFAAYHLLRYYRQQHDPIRKRSALIFMLGVVVPSVVALITDQLWQVITGVEMLELASLSMGVSGLWITYGIVRYQLFEVNPAAIATNILETMNEVVVVCSPALMIEYVSRPVEELLGYEGFDLVGLPLKEYVVDGWTQVQQLVGSNVDRDESIEVQMQTKSKGSVPVGLSMTEYRGDRGEVLAYVFVLVDLRQMRELLHTTEERDKLQATLSSMSDGVIGITADGVIGLANRAFYLMMELRDAKVIGNKLEEVIDFQDPESNASLSSEVRESIFNRESPRRGFDVALVSKLSEQTINAEIKVTRLPDKRRVELVAILTIHNVTEERQLQQMKADFTSLAAHELRTPLTSIRGYIRLLQEESASHLPKDQLEVLDRVDISSKRLSGLVDRLLEVSAIEQGRFKIEMAPVDLVSVVKRVAEEYQRKAEEGGWVLESSLPPGGVSLRVDAQRIEQVLRILLENAITYSGDDPRVGLIMRSDTQQVVVSVVDNGQGILPELQKTLFEPYSRQVAGLRQTNQGAGLSLHIAKSIVELHGGEVSIDSQVGKGSVFTIVLPRS